MIVLGLDAAATTGYALVEVPQAGRERLIEAGKIIVRGPYDVHSFLTTHYRGISLVAIEDPYLAQHGNVATLKSLCRIAAWWEMAYTLQPVPCKLMMADRWQMGLLRGLIKPGSPRVARKRAAWTWVKAWLKIELSEDACDAACLAVWAGRQRRITGRTA